MAKSRQLREQRYGTVINVTSRRQESAIIRALNEVEEKLRTKFGASLRVRHSTQWYLKDIIAELESSFPDSEFYYHFDKSSIRPDGGVLYLHDDDQRFICPILIAEVKNQGTNVLREHEGLPRQSKGNAIERLGKNVIGLRTALMRESIFPFVCFGYGCDFADDSSILDRVTTIAMFGKLNTTYLHNNSDGFNRGSFYFRENPWSVAEMADIMTDIAYRSTQYYFSRYGEERYYERGR